MEKVLSSLASEDSLKIFREVKNGITNSTEAIRKLGLTQKRYYARLKPLIEAGLIEKTDKGYNLTFLGKIIYEILYRKLEKTLKNKDRISLIDKLNKAESLSKEEKEQIAEAISVKDKTIGYSDLFDGGIKPVGIITKFEEITAGVKRLIEKAEKEVYLATRYTDPTATEAILNCLNRGIKMYLLDGDKKNLSQKIQLIRLIFSHPRMIKLFYDIFRSPNVYTGYTDNLPYSFIVADGKYVGVEIPKPDSDEFFVGLFFENELLSRKLIEVFNLLTTKAKEDPRKEFSEKITPQSLNF